MEADEMGGFFDSCCVRCQVNGFNTELNLN